MCAVALVGAEAAAFPLLEMLTGRHNELDVAVVNETEQVPAGAPADTVVRVTLDGCSCSLLQGLGSLPGNEAHVAGPGYVFRSVIAAAVLRFGGVRLRIVKGGVPSEAAPRVTRLQDFLRFGLLPTDTFIAIVP
jgi:hypothetical protein